MKRVVNRERARDTRGQATQFPEVQSQLAKAEAKVVRLKAQKVELEKIKK